MGKGKNGREILAILHSGQKLWIAPAEARRLKRDIVEVVSEVPYVIRLNERVSREFYCKWSPFSGGFSMNGLVFQGR